MLNKSNEESLENNPPVPTLVPGPLPLHSFHGFEPKRNVLSLGLRDMNDIQVLRANGNNYVVAQCVRGNKQVNSLDPVFFLFFSSCPNIDSTTYKISFPLLMNVLRSYQSNSMNGQQHSSQILCSPFRTSLTHPLPIPKNGLRNRTSGRCAG